MSSPSIPTPSAAGERSVTFRADHDGAPSVDVSLSNSTAPLLPVDDSLNHRDVGVEVKAEASSRGSVNGIQGEALGHQTQPANACEFYTIYLLAFAHCLRLSNALDGAAQAACELQNAWERFVREDGRYLLEVKLFESDPDATASTASMADGEDGNEDVNGDVATAEEVNGDHLGGEEL
ncbi:hypothetical protein JCM10212_003771 [Sporobolomyces blumeae]